MAGIQPISGVGSANLASRVQQARGGQAGQKTGFQDALKGAIEEVDGKQQASSSAIQDLLGGKTQDVLPVVNAVAKADMSFKLLLGVRNKVVEAYKQTMNMQV